MAEKRTATKVAKRTSKRTDNATTQWTEEEIAAMQEHAKELKAAKTGKTDGESEVLAKISEMPEPDRRIAKRIHALVKASAPELTSRTYYGMPAYAKDGKVLCFFQPGAKFKARYASFGFEDSAKLDDGAMWPVSFALKELTPDGEAKIAALLKKAVGS